MHFSKPDCLIFFKCRILSLGYDDALKFRKDFYDKVKIVDNQIKVKERSKQIHVTVTHPNITSGLLGDCITSPLSDDAASEGICVSSFSRQAH